MTTGENQGSPPQPDDWLSVAEVMELLGISRRTVYRYVELGHLPRTQLPGRGLRFARDDVRALVRARSA